MSGICLRPIALGVIALISLVGRVEAQGKGKGPHHAERDRGRGVIVQQGTKQPKRIKVLTSDEAVDVSRSVLLEHGYELVRVERRGETRIVYYRRGSKGRGHGKGPVMYMVVRPARDRILIERAPGPVLMQINIRLGY